MGYRIFTDSSGTEWQTWDVIPHLADRRAADRRRQERSSPPPSVPADRRADRERRVVAGRRPLLSAGLDGGWLCFEAEAAKRRLYPIPADWERCDVQCLEGYCRAAKPANRVSAAINVATLRDSFN